MPASGEALFCPVCKGAQIEIFAQARDSEYYSVEETFTYVRCRACHSVFLESPPTDRLHVIYPRNYYSYRPAENSLLESVKQVLDARLFRKLIRQISGDNISVLDVGGGSGWLLSVIRRVSSRVKETHIVDIDETARPAAEAAGNVFHCCRIENFSTSRKFDLILMLNLVEHVADPGEVLLAMRKLLSPSGLILIKTPNVDTLDCRLFRNHNWGGFHCPRHFVLFNRQSFEDLGRRCGLRVVKAAYTQGAPQWACSILGWLGLKGSIKVSADRPLYTHPLYPVVAAVAAAFDLLRSPFMKTAQMFVVFGLASN